jgi:hypothetical protein
LGDPEPRRADMADGVTHACFHRVLFRLNGGIVVISGKVDVNAKKVDPSLDKLTSSFAAHDERAMHGPLLRLELRVQLQ